jgi:endonuclease III
VELDPAISEAMDNVLAAQPDQSDMFKRRFRTLVELILTGNYQDPDVRRVMELLIVNLEADD